MSDYPVQFIRPTDAVPRFDIPPYKGERYEAMVPDTLDVQERAALAVNGLTGPTDPEKGYLLYFLTHFSANPPVMTHGRSDICQTKFMEALPLMRLVSGSDHNSCVDPVWMATALRMIGPDGLVYWPSFPWAKTPDWTRPDPQDSPHYCIPMFSGRAISAMTVYMVRDPRGPWEKELRRVVQALSALAIHKGDYAYFPQGEFVPDGPRPREAEMPTGMWSSLVGWTTQGLAHFHRATGDERARDLAAKLSRYLRFHGKYYGPNGEFLPNGSIQCLPPSPNPELSARQTHWREGVYPFDPGYPNDQIHFQHHMIPLLGMLDHALAAGDRDLAEFVRASFEWARQTGDTTVGYFPENVGCEMFQVCETCNIAGMIGLALKLSAAGVGDYWDDADRWIRNQFAENQLRRADWMYRVHMGNHAHAWQEVPPPLVDPIRQTSDHVPERNVGAFAGWPSANDLYAGVRPGMQQCCTGNGTRALYYVWGHILTHQERTLKVNLLLNRPSRWADVHSHIPYAGQVDVHIKMPCTLKVRIPEWTTPAQTNCRVSGVACPLVWEGRYAVIGDVARGEVVQISFPIGEKEKHVDIEKQHYILTIKGNDVVDIFPRGTFCPLYQRDHYRENSVRWRKVMRFVSDENIRW